MQNLKTYLALATLLFAAIALSACGDDDDSSEDPTPATTAADGTPEPASVRFMAGFKAQANLPFVGAYVAQEMGFFADENLDVTIDHVATPGDNFRFLATDEVQITTADASALLEQPRRRPAAAPHLDRAHRPDRPAGVRSPHRLGHHDARGLGRQDRRLQGQPGHARLPRDPWCQRRRALGRQRGQGGL